MANRYLWIEQYQPCGCSTEASHKKDLLGYCAQHGGDRKVVYKVPRKQLREPTTAPGSGSDGGTEP